jgi:hypothetical protein
MSDKVAGRVVKWVDERGWGIINAYLGANAPQKFFCHVSNFLPLEKNDYYIGVGMRVEFTPGPPRNEKELPIATVILPVVPQSNFVSAKVQEIDLRVAPVEAVQS